MLSNYLICSGVGGGGLAVIYNFEICFIGAGQGRELHNHFESRRGAFQLYANSYNI